MLQLQEMLHDRLGVALHRCTFAHGQFLEFLDEVHDVDILGPTFAQELRLLLEPAVVVRLVEICVRRVGQSLGHFCIPTLVFGQPVARMVLLHCQCATAAAPCSSTSWPLAKRSRANGAAIGCGSPLATVQANTWPEPGVALKPPVPQPQLMNMFSTGVLPMIGLRSGVTSTIPPHWRSMRMRENAGNSATIACKVCSITWKLPRWLYDVN